MNKKICKCILSQLLILMFFETTHFKKDQNENLSVLWQKKIIQLTNKDDGLISQKGRL